MAAEHVLYITISNRPTSPSLILTSVRANNIIYQYSRRFAPPNRPCNPTQSTQCQNPSTNHQFMAYSLSHTDSNRLQILHQSGKDDLLEDFSSLPCNNRIHPGSAQLHRRPVPRLYIHSVSSISFACRPRLRCRYCWIWDRWWRVSKDSGRGRLLCSRCRQIILLPTLPTPNVRGPSLYPPLREWWCGHIR